MPSTKLRRKETIPKKRNSKYLPNKIWKETWRNIIMCLINERFKGCNAMNYIQCHHPRILTTIQCNKNDCLLRYFRINKAKVITIRKRVLQGFTHNCSFFFRRSNWTIMESSIYLDYNATTPMSPEVRKAVTDSMSTGWGNPSSSYATGR